MKVLAAMSGGVDSSVAALLLHQSGHDVTGVTMKLWGGPSDVGCCSVSDVDDARRAADSIGIPHFVFNFGEEFQANVVEPYVTSHQKSETPNPCIECNRHIKFDTLTSRARTLGFDAVATGHHAQIIYDSDNIAWLARGADSQKDQSYVLHMLAKEDLEYVLFPIGHLTKTEVRDIAAAQNLRLAQKSDSYEVCFIQKSSGREKFLGERMEFTPAEVFNTSGEHVGSVPSAESLTIGQRKGIGIEAGVGVATTSQPQYIISINSTKAGKRVTVGQKEDLLTTKQAFRDLSLRDGFDMAPAQKQAQTDIYIQCYIQCSAHGQANLGKLVLANSESNTEQQPHIEWQVPQPRIAPGQSLVFYSTPRMESNSKREPKKEIQREIVGEIVREIVVGAAIAT